MKYVDSMAVLQKMLDVLKDGQRTQIPKLKLQNVSTLMLTLNNLKESSNLMLQSIQSDLFLSLESLKEDENIEYLSYDMKCKICDSIRSMMKIIADEAYEYYKINDFDLNDNQKIIDTFRLIVSYKYGGN